MVMGVRNSLGLPYPQSSAIRRREDKMATRILNKVPVWSGDMAALPKLAALVGGEVQTVSLPEPGGSMVKWVAVVAESRGSCKFCSKPAVIWMRTPWYFYPADAVQARGESLALSRVHLKVTPAAQPLCMGHLYTARLQSAVPIIRVDGTVDPGWVTGHWEIGVPWRDGSDRLWYSDIPDYQGGGPDVGLYREFRFRGGEFGDNFMQAEVVK